MDGEPAIDAAPAIAQRRRGGRFGRLIVILLIAGFVVVLIERNRIRAEWWAWRLARTDLPAEQAFYVGSLAAVGEDGVPAVRRLARSDRVEARSLAVVALGQMRCPEAYAVLGERIHDEDRDIRETAALTLVFAAPADVAIGLLDGPAREAAPGPSSTALAALGRLADGRAVVRLCEAVQRHPSAAARAQAAESLGDALASAAPVTDCDSVAALVRALADGATFDGALANERQIAAVTGFVAHSTTLPVERSTSLPDSGRRTVGQVARTTLTALCGRPIDPAEAAVDPAGFAERCRGWIAARRAARP